MITYNSTLDIDMGNPLHHRIHLMKFLGDDPWRSLGGLLKDDPDATLITEALIFRKRTRDLAYNGVVELTLEESLDAELAILQTHRDSEKYSV